MPASATLLILAGCAPLSTLEPAGPAAGSIATLWWIMLAGATVLTIFTLGLLGVSYLRPGWIARFTPRVWIGALGIGMPAVVLMLLLVAALAQGETLLPRAGAANVMRIEVVARQWSWEFSYPEVAGASSTDVLHLPAGVPVDLAVTGADVIHSFWIPRLGGKIDAIPGHTNVIRLEADRPGTYHGVCAEFCGTGHTLMQFVAEAHEPDAFASALEALR